MIQISVDYITNISTLPHRTNRSGQRHPSFLAAASADQGMTT